jgi:hypothetical protein
MIENKVRNKRSSNFSFGQIIDTLSVKPLQFGFFFYIST